VCPTGIDIRNGTQMECVNCTACIDACDDIMDKTHQARGLIRYASQNEIAEGRKFRWTPRMKFYSGLLLALFAGFLVMLFNRSDVETTLLRQPGSLYQTLPNGNLTNVYTLQLVNKTLGPVEVELRLESPTDGTLRLQNNTAHIQSAAEEVTNGLCIVELPRSAVTGMRTNVRIGVYLNGELEEVIETAFIGPGGASSLH
jgi:polyferredoxin